MNTVTRFRHFIAVLAIMAAASAYGYMALVDDQAGDAQTHCATAAVKEANPQAMREDCVFGESGLWQLWPPLPRWAVRQSLQYLGNDDPLLPFRYAVGPLAFIYLCGMYVLLLGRSRRWTIALFVSLMSSKVVHALGGSYWGVGSLASAEPYGLLMTLTPWLVLAFLKFQDHKLLPLVFLTIGLLGNIHPAGAMNLALVLVLVHIIVKPLAGGRWLGAAACVAFAVIGAGPELWRYFELRSALAEGAAPVDAAAATAVLQLAGMKVFYGDMLESSLRWVGALATLVVPTCVVLVRSDTRPIKNKAPWLAMIAAVLLVSLGLHVLNIFAGVALRSLPPTVDFLGASALLMLPLYVFFAEMLRVLSRAARAYRLVLRGLCLVLLVGWLMLSDNLRPARYQILEATSVFMKDADKPQSIQRHRDRSCSRHELSAIAKWLRDNSDPSAVIISNSDTLRLNSRRAVVAGDYDVRYFYHLAPGRLQSWGECLKKCRILLAGKLEAADVRRFVNELKHQDLFTGANQWYVLSSASPDTGRDLQEIVDPQWGRSCRLFRLP